MPNFCSLFSKQALSFSDKIIQQQSDLKWSSDDLKKCFDAIKQAQPKLSGAQRFKKLGGFV